MRRASILCISLLSAIGISSADPQEKKDHVSFHFHEISLRASLDSLMRWFPVSIVYLDREVEGKKVSAACTGCDFQQALNSILEGTSLTWIRRGNQVMLQEWPPEKRRPAGTISGVVTDSLTGEWIAGGTVLLQDSLRQSRMAVRRWCPTNAFGFYSLRAVAPGRYTLVVRALGYRSAAVTVEVKDDGPIRQSFPLAQHSITMEEVTVEGRRTAMTSTQGFSRGIYVRSTPTDQTEYLLDGARIYNPSHFGGVLSTFNAEVLNDVQVTVGGLPPYYGGRIGGILDLSMRDGTNERLSGSAGIGSLGSHLSLEGPVTAGTTFLLSGRRGYPEPPVPLLKEHGTPSPLGLTEITAKLSHRLSPEERLSLSGYTGRDSYDNQTEGNGAQLGNHFSWGNVMLNAGWSRVASPSLFLYASAVYTRYHFWLDHVLTGSVPVASEMRLSSRYAIEDIAVRANAEEYYDESHTVRGGVELVYHRMKGWISEFSTRTGYMSLDGLSSWELSVYLQDQWKVLPHVMADVGARATNFAGSDGSFSSIDPRFSMLVSLSEQTRLYTSLTSINQYLHPYRNSGVFLFYPTIFWYPSTEKVKPSNSLQVTLGAETGDDTYTFSAESFYRVTYNLHEAGLDTAAWSRDLSGAILFGTGRSYGLELTLRKRTGDLTGSMSYTLSWGKERFAEINAGEPFDPRFDRRHELQLSASYTPAEDWTFGVLCVVASNRTPSLESQIAESYRNDPAGAASAAREFIDLNGGRLPGFQRLELSATKKFSISAFQCLVSLRLLNEYGLVDPFIWTFRGGADPRMMWSATLKEMELFPLFPTMGLIVRF
jgi:hypothetical protein